MKEMHFKSIYIWISLFSTTNMVSAKNCNINSYGFLKDATRPSRPNCDNPIRHRFDCWSVKIHVLPSVIYEIKAQIQPAFDTTCMKMLRYVREGSKDQFCCRQGVKVQQHFCGLEVELWATTD